MTVVYGLIWTSWILFSLSALWALTWAARTGQFDNISQGARNLFDEEEPVGEMTDTFPDVDPDDVE